MRKNAGSENKRKILHNMYIQKRVITKIVVKERNLWLRLKEARKSQSDVAGNKNLLKVDKEDQTEELSEV